ncbi:UDP-N-acetylmuramate:L-alanyl-gamma-D-glutamyl-meso-diaminopimelate ligase [Chromohalobacter israelensis]|uniref:UDP-N-acetylmuramate:L-alanyl-gamma-D-glutamyl- meso-diaminopimelate ligase n=1 Tax=Chromohalobacter israelensis TaxID=141390 RepID=UPI0015C42376|nr:UDP-N-acetylmuramate:L-alanyl-gamma-D-glutamyl-meso-diaminopimelate ligase [Chromohalobacter salexigens]NWO54686.1 UDP-N-acetylmuramate:L-alanyl-gamma-D-glutamyl-meso-diaminopimelate ligase [Chromohalobacter salexigens]
MHVHILGVCGTFMGSLARLAKALGHQVSGSDANVYPPMSTQLEEAGIALCEGYAADNLMPRPDLVIIGNALSRGNPEVEAVLNAKLPYVSGPQWLAEQVLPGRRVVAVAGTHGKTTTASLLTWILEAAGQAPGFLIGGVPRNLGVSSRLGEPGAPFVVEADEYDTAFFDKRSKFVHYRPDIAVLGNLEFDHADIFPDLAAIERQFHHLVRTVPGEGQLVVAAGEPALERVLAQGCWSPVVRFGASDDASWQWRLESADGRRFAVRHGERVAHVDWALSGRHNVANAVAALAAASACGVALEAGAAALARFESPRRRQEVRGEVGGIQVIDDFAHHPTAIAATLEGLAAATDAGRLLAVIEPRSNTMRLGSMRERLPDSVAAADRVWWYRPPEVEWSLEALAAACPVQATVSDEMPALVEAIVAEARPGDRIVVMSNGAFGGIHEKLLAALEARHGG